MVAGYFVLLIAQVMVQLAGQHALHQRLGQFLHQTVRSDQASFATGDQLVDQFFLDGHSGSPIFLFSRTAFTQSFLHPPELYEEIIGSQLLGFHCSELDFWFCGAVVNDLLSSAPIRRSASGSIWVVFLAIDEGVKP